MSKSAITLTADFRYSGKRRAGASISVLSEGLQENLIAVETALHRLLNANIHVQQVSLSNPHMEILAADNIAVKIHDPREGRKPDTIHASVSIPTIMAGDREKVATLREHFAVGLLKWSGIKTGISVTIKDENRGISKVVRNRTGLNLKTPQFTNGHGNPVKLKQLAKEESYEASPPLYARAGTGLSRLLRFR